MTNNIPSKFCKVLIVQVIEAATVIVTVPLTQLQKRSIHFDPPLPDSFLQTVDKLCVTNAVKVFAVFSRAFWEDSQKAQDAVAEAESAFSGLYCPGVLFRTSELQSWFLEL